MRRIKIVGALLAFGTLVTGCTTPSKCVPLQVAPGVFEGCLPVTEKDFQTLHQNGIRTVLSLETLIYHISPERKLARQAGITFRNVPILPSIVRPREQRVKEALLIINDASLHPIFVHCLVGDDRTSFIIGLYRMYYQNWTPDAAWREMLNSGFHSRWWLSGLETYFWRHSQKPEWAQVGGSYPTP